MGKVNDKSQSTTFFNVLSLLILLFFLERELKEDNNIVAQKVAGFGL